MEVAHGGADVAVAEPLLQVVQVDPGFEQVGGVAVAQGVDTAALGDAGVGAGAAVPALGHADVQGLIGVAQRAEQPATWPRHLPPGARHGQRVGAQRHEAILGALALHDVDAHAVSMAVDVFDA